MAIAINFNKNFRDDEGNDTGKKIGLSVGLTDDEKIMLAVNDNAITDTNFNFIADKSDIINIFNEGQELLDRYNNKKLLNESNNDEEEKS
jgi:hypothetical protein